MMSMKANFETLVLTSGCTSGRLKKFPQAYNVIDLGYGLGTGIFTSIPSNSVGGDNGVGKGEGFSGTCMKDIWTKLKGSRIKGGKWGWWGGEEWWGVNRDNCT